MGRQRKPVISLPWICCGTTCYCRNNHINLLGKNKFTAGRLQQSCSQASGKGKPEAQAGNEEGAKEKGTYTAPGVTPFHKDRIHCTSNEGRAAVWPAKNSRLEVMKPGVSDQALHWIVVWFRVRPATSWASVSFSATGNNTSCHEWLGVVVKVKYKGVYKNCFMKYKTL